MHVTGPTGPTGSFGPINPAILAGPIGWSGQTGPSRPSASVTGATGPNVPAHDRARALASLDPKAEEFTFLFRSDDGGNCNEIARGTLDEIWPIILDFNTPRLRVGVFVLDEHGKPHRLPGTLSFEDPVKPRLVQPSENPSLVEVPQPSPRPREDPADSNTPKWVEMLAAIESTLPPEDLQPKNGGATVDPSAVREHLSIIAARVKAALNGAEAPGLLQLSRLHPTGNKLVPRRFHVDDVEGMIEAAVTDSEAGHNAYIEARMVRLGLNGNARGKLADTAAIFAYVIDSDADKQMGWAPTKPVSMTVETSPGNFQYWLFLREAIFDAERGQKLGERIRAATHTDHDTGTVTQPYRVAGTINYPSQSKIARGRTTVPTRLVGFDPKVLWTPEEIEQAFPLLERKPEDDSEDATAAGASTADEASIPDDTLRVISEGVPKGQQSHAFWNVMLVLKRRSFTIDGINKLLEKYPDGIAKKYCGRLQDEVERAYNKIKSKPTQPQASEEKPPLIVELGSKLWGAATEVGDEYRFGADQAKVIDPRKGIWFDFAVNKGGTLRDLMKKVEFAGREQSNADDVVTVCAAGVVARPLDWIWEGHLLRGSQELMSGLPDLSKSTVQIGHIACATARLPWPDGAKAIDPMNVIMLTAEDTLDQIVVPRLLAAGADLNRISFLKCIKTDEQKRQFLLAEDLDRLEHLVKKIGDVGLITVDPITAYMGGSKHFDSHRATDVRGQLGPLKDFAERMNIALSTITHPAKSAGPRALDHFIGSQAFIAASRVGHLCVAEMEESETGEQRPTGRVLFINVRNTAHAKMPTLVYRKEIITVGTEPRLITAPRIKWEGPVDIADEAAIAAASGKKLDQQPKVQAFLRELLKDNKRVAQKEIEEAAAKKGFTPRQLRTARERLGINPVKETGKMGGSWFWQLPDPGEGRYHY